MGSTRTTNSKIMAFGGHNIAPFVVSGYVKPDQEDIPICLVVLRDPIASIKRGGNHLIIEVGLE